MSSAARARRPDADTVARQRGLAASHQARWDAETGERDPWWVWCDVAKFIAFLEETEREKGIHHDCS